MSTTPSQHLPLTFSPDGSLQVNPRCPGPDITFSISILPVLKGSETLSSPINVLHSQMPSVNITAGTPGHLHPTLTNGKSFPSFLSSPRAVPLLIPYQL